MTVTQFQLDWKIIPILAVIVILLLATMSVLYSKLRKTRPVHKLLQLMLPLIPDMGYNAQEYGLIYLPILLLLDNKISEEEQRILMTYLIEHLPDPAYGERYPWPKYDNDVRKIWVELQIKLTKPQQT